MLLAADEGGEASARQWRLPVRREWPADDGQRCGARAPGLISVHGAIDGESCSGDMMIDGVSRQGCGRSVF